jgi:hypothetical protein
MTKNAVPKATHTGEIQIGDAVIPCAVLEDGRRVLTQEGFLQAMGRARKAKGGQGASLEKAPAFLAAKNLKPFISEELEESSKAIIFKGIKGQRSYGYPAELLPKICDVFLDAEEEGALLTSQKHIAVKAKVLMRGLAHVGIAALVDEATGYQEERDRDALHKILEAYISKELLPWAKRFPDEFYIEMAKLRGLPYDALLRSRPSYVGTLTNKYVYEQMPPGVMATLREKNPPSDKTGKRTKKHHQYLTEDIGNPHLERHLVAVIALMRASTNWDKFKQLFARAFPPAQSELDLGFDDEKD